MRECADAVPRAVHRAAREKRTGQTAAGAHGGTSPVPLKPHILTFPSGAEQRPHREGTRVNPRISSWTNIGPWSTVHPYSSQLWSLCAGPPAVHGRPVAKGIWNRFEPGSRSGGAGGPPQSVRTRRVVRSPRLRRPGSDRTPLASTGRVPRVRSGVRSGVLASAARRPPRSPYFLVS